jgi:hypothetical protein
MRHQAITQLAEARQQHINKERARLTELQYTINILQQREDHQQPNVNPHPPNYPIPPPPPLFNNIPHNRPLSPPHNQYFPPPPPPPPQISTIDPKSPLAEHLQLAPWPLHYKAVLPPKYHGNADSRKFLMCYKAVVALARGDKATLAMSLIISLQDAAANW